MPNNLVGRPKHDHAGDRPETRERILGAGEKVLAAKGYNGLSMDAIAKQVSVTKATLYHHFPGGKDEIIKAVALEMVSRYRIGIEGAINSSTMPREQLIAIGSFIIPGYGEAERIMREAVNFLPIELVNDLTEVARNSIFQPIESVLQAGIREGCFRNHNTKFLTSILFTLMTVIPSYQSLRHLEAQEVLTLVMDLVFRGIEK